MNNTILALFYFLWIYYCLPITGGLWCYQCASANVNEDCETDYKGMNKSAVTREGRYAKDCSSVYRDQNSSTSSYCVIESHSTAGGTLKSFIRECSDGERFSYNIKEGDTIPLLKNLQPNNQTSCVTFTNTLICLTLCDEDFCNGPRPNVTEPCFVNGTNITCGSTSHVHWTHPVVFGVVVDGIMGNIITAPFVVSGLLAYILQ